MNDKYSNLFRFNNSGLGCLLNIILVSLLLGAIGLGWLVKGLILFILVLILIPFLAIFAFRWWAQKNLVESQCPACNYTFSAVNNSECQCPNCGKLLQVQSGHFLNVNPPGTIDVEAVEVSLESREDYE